METDSLAKLIGQKRQALAQLLELCLRQDKVVSAADWNGLMKILSAKEQLLSRLQQTERQLDPYRLQDPQSRTWRSEEEKQTVRKAAKECETMLEHIVRLEKQSGEALVRRRDETARQLQGVHAASEARGAYVRSQQSTPARLDATRGDDQ